MCINMLFGTNKSLKSFKFLHAMISRLQLYFIFQMRFSKWIENMTYYNYLYNILTISTNTKKRILFLKCGVNNMYTILVNIILLCTPENAVLKKKLLIAILLNYISA